MQEPPWSDGGLQLLSCRNSSQNTKSASLGLKNSLQAQGGWSWFRSVVEHQRHLHISVEVCISIFPNCKLVCWTFENFARITIWWFSTKDQNYSRLLVSHSKTIVEIIVLQPVVLDTARFSNQQRVKTFGKLPKTCHDIMRWHDMLFHIHIALEEALLLSKLCLGLEPEKANYGLRHKDFWNIFWVTKRKIVLVKV